MKAMRMLLAVTGTEFAVDKPYPAMADVRQYRMNKADEILITRQRSKRASCGQTSDVSSMVRPSRAAVLPSGVNRSAEAL